MAKKVDDDSADKPNTFDPKRVEKIVNKIEHEHEGLLTERMSYMGKCRPYRERIGQHYEEGIGFGIPKAVLKAKIKERALLRQIDGIPDDFEDDERETYEQLSQALGEYADTPLGKAAMGAKAEEDAKPKAVRGRPRKTPLSSSDPGGTEGAEAAGDEEPDIRSDAQKLVEREREEEAARVAAENADKLNAGISQLPH